MEEGVATNSDWVKGVSDGVEARNCVVKSGGCMDVCVCFHDIKIYWNEENIRKGE